MIRRNAAQLAKRGPGCLAFRKLPERFGGSIKDGFNNLKIDRPLSYERIDLLV
jgi:hypothetical protein